MKVLFYKTFYHTYTHKISSDLIVQTCVSAVLCSSATRFLTLFIHSTFIISVFKALVILIDFNTSMDQTLFSNNTGGGR